MNMKELHERRTFLKRMGFALGSLLFSVQGIAGLLSSRKKDTDLTDANGYISFTDNFSIQNDRVWIGEDYWAIPMEDWRINKGRVEFTGSEKNSTVEVLTSVISEGSGEVVVSVKLGLLKRGLDAKGGKAGFLIGIKDELDSSVQAACYYGSGIKAGLATSGKMFIGDQLGVLPSGFDFTDVSLSLKAKTSGKSTIMRLTCTDKRNRKASLEQKLDTDISGLIALANNYELGKGDATTCGRHYGGHRL